MRELRVLETLTARGPFFLGELQRACGEPEQFPLAFLFGLAETWRRVGIVERTHDGRWRVKPTCAA